MTDEGKSFGQYLNNLTKHATDAFKDHRLVKSEGRRWLIKGKDGGLFWVEVVALAGPMLLVHGDIDCVLFAYAGKHYKPKQLVRWIGDSSLDYAREKASIGTGHEIATDTDPDLAIWELHQLVKDAEENEDQSVLRYSEEIADAIRQLNRGEHVDLVGSELYRAGLDPEFLSGFGRAVSARVAYAHAAAAKLVELLEQEEEEQDDSERRHEADDNERRHGAAGAQSGALGVENTSDGSGESEH